MDAHSLDIRALKKSCIHIAQPDGRLIPFESFNLFYRDQRAEILAQIRDELTQSFRFREGSSSSRSAGAVTMPIQVSPRPTIATGVGSTTAGLPRNT